MPGVVFYYDNDATLKKYFGSYTNGHDWNAPGAITDADPDGPNDFALTEAGILDALQSKASAYAKTTGVADGDKFYQLILDIANGKNKEFTFYVLKGIHTKPQLHFSVGFAGKIYHLNVKRRGDDNKKFSISSMSEGGQTWDDPEWKVVK
ncbi:MAG: hypothetical protein R3C14_38660 [Caldilineaceae bacterium]